MDYLMWVGEGFYTFDSFVREAEKLGCCKRIPYIPKSLIPGVSRVYLIYPFSQKKRDEKGKIIEKTLNPKIFGFFVVRGVDLVLFKEQKISAYDEEREKYNINYVKANDAEIEPERGCGHRVLGALYLVSEKDMDVLQQVVEKIGGADYANIRGHLILFNSPIPYLGKVFRGVKRFGESDHKTYGIPYTPLSERVKTEVDRSIKVQRLEAYGFRLPKIGPKHTTDPETKASTRRARSLESPTYI